MDEQIVEQLDRIANALAAICCLYAANLFCRFVICWVDSGKKDNKPQA